MHQIRIEVQKGHNQVATESRQRMKRGRPIGSKDKNPRKQKKGAENENKSEVEETTDMDIRPAGSKVPNTEAWDAKLQGTNGPDNNEIVIDYIMSGTHWNRKDVDIDDLFAYKVALEFMDINEDHEPTSIKECALVDQIGLK